MPLLEQVEIKPTFLFALSSEEQLRSETKEITASAPLLDLIRHLDRNWQDEGLSQDWYTLGNRVGFSMNKQMELLPELEDQSLTLWIDRTEQDIHGFWLEYLTPDINIYPYRYLKKVSNDGEMQLINLRYQKDIAETASRQERNGSVVETLEKIKRFFTDPQTIDGSLAIMVSPMGPTGLKTDDGNPIIYPDSYFFLFEKKGDLVEGFTIQTDFTKQECREVIRRLIGIQLPENASEEEYVRATAFLSPLLNHAGIKTKEDIINLLSIVRKDLLGKSGYAYKKISWDKVTRDVNRVNDLYNLDLESDEIVDQWKIFMSEKHFMQPGADHAEQEIRLSIQKALAATILRLSKLSLGRTFVRDSAYVFQLSFRAEQSAVEESTKYHQERSLHSSRLNRDSVGMTNNAKLIYNRVISPFDDFTFGDAQDYAQSQPGCAGGGAASNEPGKIGASTILESIVKRYGTIGESTASDNCPTIKCKNCGWQASNSEAKAIQEKKLTTCPVCGWKPSN